jgi:hypothetical protein
MILIKLYQNNIKILILLNIDVVYVMVINNHKDQDHMRYKLVIFHSVNYIKK